MSSLHHWLVALARGLKRDKHKRRIRRGGAPAGCRLKLEAYREQNEGGGGPSLRSSA